MNIAEALGEGLCGLEFLQNWIALKGRPPIGETLGFDLIEVEEGRAVFAAIPNLRHYNPIGMVHGGFAATLLDSACGCAVHTRLTATQAYTTLELKVAYHKALTHETGLVRAEGQVLTMGRRVAYSEAKLLDAAGRLYASASSTLLIMERA